MDVFIDANIFLEIALQDAKKEACKQLLTQLPSNSCSTSDFILYTCLLQLEKRTHRSQHLKNFLQFIQILSYQILRPSQTEMRRAIEYMTLYQLDFDDALVVSCMHHNGIKTLLSLDKDFDRVKGIKRIEP